MKIRSESVCAINLLLYLSDSPPVLCHPKLPFIQLEVAIQDEAALFDNVLRVMQMMQRKKKAESRPDFRSKYSIGDQ